jgi:putative ABC transport system permease protein
MRVSLPASRYREAPRRTQFYRDLVQRIAAVPGVQATGAISFLPLTGLGSATSYEAVGQPNQLGQEPVTDVRVITGEYFKSLGIPLLRGRVFDENNPSDTTNKIVVNETLARVHWPGQDPIGKRIKVSWRDNIEDEIIGVVGDVRMTELNAPARAAIYWPHAREAYGSMTMVVRGTGDPTSAIRAILRERDPDLALADVRSMDEVVARSVAQRRITMVLLGVFAGAALLLAAIGIYGVIAYSVTQRTQEIGIRVALGAQRSDVLRMIIRGAVILAVAGVVIGAGGAFFLTRLMRDLLFGVQPFDLVTFGTVALLLTLVALLASYIPGRRATRVDPIVALRGD